MRDLRRWAAGSHAQDSLSEKQIDDVFQPARLGERPELTLGAIAAVERRADDMRNFVPISVPFECRPEERQHGFDEHTRRDGFPGLDVDEFTVKPESGGAPACGLQQLGSRRAQG